jgi:hypothetical protein|tara:strand:+ start:438 stop:680 length:243 start_codon:yes stop_codon:yes gene_type:complete
MKLPKLYSIKSISQKKDIVSKIIYNLKVLDAEKFPNVSMQIKNDNSKIELIETIINNLYSGMGVYSIGDAISSIEVTLND